MLPRADKEWTVAEAAHLVRRAGFGGSPREIRRIHALGREAAVEGLLRPDEPLDAFPAPEWADPAKAAAEARERFAMLRERRREMRDLSPEEREKARRQLIGSRQRESRQQTVSAQRWWFERMLKTRAPLREKMVLFWHDHFATSVQKVRRPVLMMEQNRLFRERAFGDFKALTHAILRDPAMMLYLDTQNSRKGNPNENFAREVMELFTLGEGRYSEADIKEAARAFTGYTLNRLTHEVSHQRSRWDEGEKTVFGRRGAFDGDDVIDILFEQEAAAEYLPAKLWTYFVEDVPPAAVVKRLAAGFRDSGFRVEPVLREIFLSRAFYDSSVRRDQIKSPVQFLVQLCKELELEELPDGFALVAQNQLGQVLFLPPNVAGWDWGKGWINTNSLLNRYNVAGTLTKGAIPAEGVEAGGEGMMEDMTAGMRGGAFIGRQLRRSMEHWSGPDYEKLAPRALREDPEKLVDALIGRLFQEPVGDQPRETFIAFAAARQGVVFTNHEVAELCHLMMSTPQYQLA